jgi:hypothetical protein
MIIFYTLFNSLISFSKDLSQAPFAFQNAYEPPKITQDVCAKRKIVLIFIDTVFKNVMPNT